MELFDSFSDLVHRRRSIRKFESRTIPDEVIDSLLHLATKSPSSHNTRSWQFVVVSDSELIKALSQARPSGSAFVADAPCVIIPLADTTLTTLPFEDLSIASTILLLAAESLSLGACWVQLRAREHSDALSASDYVRELLNIPSQYALLNMIPVGYKAAPARQHSDAFDTARVHHNRF